MEFPVGRPQTTAALNRSGLDAGDLARLVAAGELERLRRGGYTVPDAERTPEDRHRLLVAAALPRLHPDAVLSHGSAGVLHDLPVWADSMRTVHVIRTRPEGSGARTRAGVRIHASPLSSPDVTTVDGLPVTTLARTVADLARTTSFTAGVCVADRALVRLDRPTLLAQVERAHGWQGVRRARRVVDFADRLAESPLESVSRVKLMQAGVPAPQLQVEVHDRLDRLVGRSDFGWEEFKTLGECDGRIKYGRLLRPGQPVEDVVHAEKLREDALRDLGYQVVRWTAAELDTFPVVLDRLERAFARGRRSSTTIPLATPLAPPLAPMAAQPPRDPLTHPVHGVVHLRRGG